MNVSNLELILVQKISNSTSTLDTLIYSKALQELKTGTVTVVNTTADLPNPNTAFIGHLFYEKTTEAMYIVDKLGYAKKIPIERNLYTWGSNTSGSLGDGTTTNRSSPGTVAGPKAEWLAVSFGRLFATALKSDCTLWTWGYNANGQLGDNTTTSRSSPNTTAGGGTSWCALSAGAFHTAAIKTDGTLWTWGAGLDGRLGDGTTTGRSSPGTTAGGGATWCQVALGFRHGAAIKTDGTLWTWGYNNAGQLGTGTTTTRSSPGTVAGGGSTWCMISAASSGYHNVAIKTDGTLWTWGNNANGVLGDGSTTGRSSPGTVAGGGTSWATASAGCRHTLAIKTDGTLWTWGYNSQGQLGDGTTTARCSPGTVAGGGTNWCTVSGGAFHSTAVKTDGTLWTWGNNGYGRLGDGTTTSRSSPGTVAGGGTSWSKVGAGYHGTAALGPF